MPIFALRKIEAIKGRQQFDKLVVDGKCPFDEFEANLEEQYKAEMAGIYHYMQDVADLKPVSDDKYHFYDKDKKQRRKDGVREFEFKSKHLRVYGITKPNGKIIITGGTKARQKVEQGEFRRLKNLYLASLTSETTKNKTT
jgi:hypothetical protein